MCGIAGGVGKSSQNEAELRKQISSIKHRGPDDEGFYFSLNVSLGMCRLAIVEIKEGHQPFLDDLNSVRIVFNGEIYNYKSMAKNINGDQGSKVVNSESALIAYLYKLHGTNCFNHLEGMFAIAIYDEKSQELHLARDRAGEKPCYYRQFSDGSLQFSSQVRALALDSNGLKFRVESIAEILTLGYVDSPSTAFDQIFELEPGHFLTWKQGKITIERYWSPSFLPKKSTNYEMTAIELGSLLEEVVARFIVSERPLGTFLSGGIDSTIISAIASKLMGGNLDTYSIGFQEKRYDESNYAREIAKFLGTNHHEEILTNNPLSLLDEVVNFLDVPFADSSIIPTYAVSKLARQRSVVVLSGDGGDEVFGGYKRYVAGKYIQNANFVLPLAKLGLSTASRFFESGKNFGSKRGNLFKQESLGRRYFRMQSLTRIEELPKLIHKDVEWNHDFIHKFEMYIDSETNLSSLDKMVKSDLGFYLPKDILRKVDLASMSNSLEVRSPFLDRELLEFGIRLPEKFRIKGLQSKRILKDVVTNYVPKYLIDRPKMGFGIPRAEWLRGELRELMFDCLTDSTFQSRNWFHQREIENVMNLHVRGQNLDRILWPVLMLELWARRWLD